MTTSTERHTFRATLAQAAEQARALLPEQVNGRIESAQIPPNLVVAHADPLTIRLIFQYVTLTMSHPYS